MRLLTLAIALSAAAFTTEVRDETTYSATAQFDDV